MPTPESAAFLAKKPTVPPTFDGVDYNDTPRLKAAQDAIIKEQWVRSMMARLIRQELAKCYNREGVNHLEKCGMLRERYLVALKDTKVKGYLFAQQNYIPGKQDPVGQDQVSTGLTHPSGQIATIPAEVAEERGDSRL
ncbi:MAG: hypothetical protein L6R41_007517 [Letrouitia leprolyta]|nr:MAG: hypothetical protein L6R41_007517 [Letrouitia leprolyta]